MNKPVNFEISKLLKEKEFDVNVRGRIHVSHWHLVKDNIIPSNVNTYHTDMFAPLDNWNDGKQHFMSIPTIAEVVMWLYEKNRIWIYVDTHEFGKWCYNFKKIEPTKEHPKINVNGKFGIEDYKSPAEAYEAAIKYCLTELIK